MYQKILLLAMTLFHLHVYAKSMLVNSYDPLSNRNIINGLFEEVVHITRKHPHKINKVNENGYTLLQSALINNYYIDAKISSMQYVSGIDQDMLETSIITIKMLLNNGADLNIPFPKEKFYEEGEQHFLIKATQPNTWPRFPLNIIELLFEHGLNDQARDIKGNTALMRLISLLNIWKKHSKYRMDFIRTLINHTSDFNAQNNQGDTVLHYTSKFNDLETARLIMQNPTQIDIKNSAGKTPLQISKLLAGVVPSYTSNLKWYWYFSFSSKNYKMVKLLEKTEERLQPPNDSNSSQSRRSPISTLTSFCERAFSGRTINN